VLAILAGILFGDLSISNWKLILILSILVVFFDLSLLLTPNITKLGNAEFQKEESLINQTILKMENITNSNYDRIKLFYSLLKEASQYLQSISPATPTEWDDELYRYVKLYTDEFGLGLKMWAIDFASIDTSIVDQKKRLWGRRKDVFNEALKQTLIQTLQRIENALTISFQGNTEKIAEWLRDEKFSIQGNVVVVPVTYHQKKLYIFVLREDKGTPLDIDAYYIAGMANVFFSLKAPEGVRNLNSMV
jgi:hypothetical protein